MSWRGTGGDVIPLGQGVGVPHTQLLARRDLPQHPIEDLQNQAV